MATLELAKHVVAKLRNALQQPLAAGALRERMTVQGSMILGGTPKQYIEYMKAEGTRWTAIVRETGPKAE